MYQGLRLVSWLRKLIAQILTKSSIKSVVTGYNPCYYITVEEIRVNKPGRFHL